MSKLNSFDDILMHFGDIFGIQWFPTNRLWENETTVIDEDLDWVRE
jgi:hypothetical protein